MYCPVARFRYTSACPHNSNTHRYRTERPIATVQAAGPEDVDRAVNAAHKALKDPSWKLLPASDRGTLMFRLADLMEQKKELFATIDAWDNGQHRPSFP